MVFIVIVCHSLLTHASHTHRLFYVILQKRISQISDRFTLLLQIFYLKLAILFKTLRFQINVSSLGKLFVINGKFWLTKCCRHSEMNDPIMFYHLIVNCYTDNINHNIILRIWIDDYIRLENIALLLIYNFIHVQV